MNGRLTQTHKKSRPGTCNVCIEKKKRLWLDRARWAPTVCILAAAVAAPRVTAASRIALLLPRMPLHPPPRARAAGPAMDLPCKSARAQKWARCDAWRAQQWACRVPRGELQQWNRRVGSRWPTGPGLGPPRGRARARAGVARAGARMEAAPLQRQTGQARRRVQQQRGAGQRSC